MLGIVIVNYKSENLTIEYVNKELSKITIPYIIAIVNNAATNITDEILTKNLSSVLIYDIKKTRIVKDFNIFIISNPNNDGFAIGNNIGASFLINNFDCENILFTNNDIVIMDNELVEALVYTISQSNEISLIGPNILEPNGTRNNPIPYRGLWKRWFWYYWLGPFLVKSLKNKIFKLDYAINAKEGIHYALSGSFFIVKSNSFIKIGMMDPNTFLYAEEYILAERFLNIGQFCYFYPHLSVLHLHEQTTSKHLSIIKKNKLILNSCLLFYKNYKNYSTVSITIVRISHLIYIYINYALIKNIIKHIRSILFLSKSK